VRAVRTQHDRVVTQNRGNFGRPPTTLDIHIDFVSLSDCHRIEIEVHFIELRFEGVFFQRLVVLAFKVSILDMYLIVSHRQNSRFVECIVQVFRHLLDVDERVDIVVCHYLKERKR